MQNRLPQRNLSRSNHYELFRILTKPPAATIFGGDPGGSAREQSFLNHTTAFVLQTIYLLNPIP